jgi:hypothetical protein
MGAGGQLMSGMLEVVLQERRQGACIFVFGGAHRARSLNYDSQSAQFCIADQSKARGGNSCGTAYRLYSIQLIPPNSREHKIKAFFSITYYYCIMI